MSFFQKGSKRQTQAAVARGQAGGSNCCQIVFIDPIYAERRPRICVSIDGIQASPVMHVSQVRARAVFWLWLKGPGLNQGEVCFLWQAMHNTISCLTRKAAPRMVRISAVFH